MALNPLSTPKTARVITKKIGISTAVSPITTLSTPPKIKEFTITVARINQGTLAYFPAKVRHGFITENEAVHLVTIQSPPIKDLRTGKIDFIE